MRSNLICPSTAVKVSGHQKGFHGLHGIALGLVHLQKDANKRNMQLKLLGNDIGGLAGLALGHLQVHARNGEHKHMGWKTNLLINMHGLDKPTWNANIHGVYKHNALVIQPSWSSSWLWWWSYWVLAQAVVEALGAGATGAWIPAKNSIQQSRA
jgi:hypothetical protein